MQIKLNLDETNKVLSALGKEPYAQVHELIENIVSQVKPQMNPKIEEVEDVEVQAD